MKLPLTPNPIAPPVLRTRARRQAPWLVWSLIVLCVGIPSLALYSLVSCFRLGPDARALSRGLRSGGSPGVELRLGALPMSLMRFGLRFAPLEPEARMAVEALRGVEVGIYPFGGAGDSEERSRRIAAGNAALAARGWQRVVGVANDDVTVSVHVRDDERRPERLQLCAAVQRESHVVVVSVRGALSDPLLSAIGYRLSPPGRDRKYLSNHDAKFRRSHSIVGHP
ncbi:MAG: hypothetical protein KIT22_10170 [Verrucomicrobiae bacterium]|nr:hypothetical protein [Verrucomicrobiae bacterium]